MPSGSVVWDAHRPVRHCKTANQVFFFNMAKRTLCMVFSSSLKDLSQSCRSGRFV